MYLVVRFDVILIILMRHFSRVAVIEGLKKELERCRGQKLANAFEEFISIRRKCEEEAGVKLEADYEDKKNWMSSAQLWSVNSSENNDEDDKSITDEV